MGRAKRQLARFKRRIEAIDRQLQLQTLLAAHASAFCKGTSGLECSNRLIIWKQAVTAEDFKTDESTLRRVLRTIRYSSLHDDCFGRAISTDPIN